MTLPATPLDWTVGLIGYGEVGRILAEDLRAQGVAVVAFDLKLGTAAGRALAAHADAQGVALAGDHVQLAHRSDFVISAVTASQTVAVAAACATGMRAGAFYLDFNSASPGAKQQAAALIDATGARYVEGAVMTSVPPYRIKVPLLLGGAHAAQLAEKINPLGFAAQVASERIGVASATKMCRSVMIKGLEALVIESYTAARAYGVEDYVLPTLQETFPSIDWTEQGRYFYSRVVQHGRRRAEEMREVANTVREAGFEPWMAAATAEKQDWVAGLAAQGLFADVEAAGGWQAYADRLIARARD